MLLRAGKHIIMFVQSTGLGKPVVPEVWKYFDKGLAYMGSYEWCIGMKLTTTGSLAASL